MNSASCLYERFLQCFGIKNRALKFYKSHYFANFQHLKTFRNNQNKNCIFVLIKQRIYIDTSVVGAYFDEEFEDATRRFFDRLENNEIIFVVSDLLNIELIKAPQKVRELLYNYSFDKFELIELTEEAIKLADTYIAEKVVGKTSIEDCRHIAMATINKVDVLASWNFKHIVNLERIKGYNSVNLRLGYQMIEIRSPKDLINYQNGED